ncbi:MAG: SPASM domain-containing protein [Candidatus Diapherotrites archaeon]|nr:SPASM domain-containing protein [Candidatus Diapherotrites archaeon]
MVLKEMTNDFYGGCDALTEESFMINPMGDVFLCFFLRSETYLGNVYKNSWEELISERKKKIKEVWNPGQDCIGCKFAEQCKGGCVAIRKYYGEERCKTVKKIMDSML